MRSLRHAGIPHILGEATGVISLWQGRIVRQMIVWQSQAIDRSTTHGCPRFPLRTRHWILLAHEPLAIPPAIQAPPFPSFSPRPQNPAGQAFPGRPAARRVCRGVAEHPLEKRVGQQQFGKFCMSFVIRRVQAQPADSLIPRVSLSSERFLPSGRPTPAA